MSAPHLRSAYEATTFAATIHGARMEIRIGARHPELDQLCTARGIAEWAFVTACNPGSQLLPVAENSRRLALLREDVRALELALFEGNGEPADASWQPEPSVLVLGVTRPEALSLGRRYEQHAIVVGSVGDVARLVWCDDDSPTPQSP